MKSLFIFCLTTLAIGLLHAQSPAILQSQSGYMVVQGKMMFIDTLVHIHNRGHESHPRYSPYTLDYYGRSTAYNDDTTLQMEPSKNMQLSHRFTRSFTSSGLPAEFRTEKYDTTTKQFTETAKTIYWYTSTGLPLVTWEYANNSSPLYRYTYTYKNDTLVKRLVESPDPATNKWRNNIRDSFITNGNDSTHVFYSWINNSWQTLSTARYYRDAAGRVALLREYDPLDSLRATRHYSYNAAGKLIEDSLTSYSSGQMNGIEKDVYLYDNGGNLLSRRTIQMYGPHYGDITIDSLTYNGANQLTSFSQLTYTPGLTAYPVPANARFFYYDFPLNIPGLETTDDLQLYPIPAVSYINLLLNFNKPEKFTVRIVNLNGQLVRTWADETQGAYKKQISLNGIAAGSYLLQVQTAARNITKQFAVIR